MLSKEVLADENATSLKQAILNTPGVTLGTGEGGNAFGDRFFIRGFDVRNDIFIDGVRDSGVSVRENFFTEQIEILRGPGSSFAGRGTTGGAINIVTKQATTQGSFYNMDTTFATDQTKRVVLDVNQVISPTLAVRAGGLFQDANVAGRSYTTDDRNGGFIAANWSPVDAVKITGNYIHTELTGIPDFGVPYFRPSTATTAGGPFPDFGVNRNNFYGFVNRDFFRTGQDIGTINAEVQITPDLMLSNKIRESRSTQNYVGTLPEAPALSSFTLSANPQSRLQITDVFANQTEATYKFNDYFGFKHTAVAGVEIDRETSSIDSYVGLGSEITTGPTSFTGAGSRSGVSIFFPQFTNAQFGPLALAGRPTNVGIDTNSGYLIDTANYHDLLILNGGIRYDDYNVSTAGYGTGGAFGQQSAQFGLPNFNLGLTLKPQPNGSVYVAYATSSNPVGAEFDGTSTAYGGLSPFLAGNSNQIFGPEKNKAIEVGTKWELFDRHLLVTAALFQTNKENAREAFNVSGTATQTASCPYRGTTISCIVAGSAYYVRGIDLGIGGKITDKWSVFGGLVLDAVEGDPVECAGGGDAGSLALSDQCRAAASQRGEPILQHAEQVSADRHVGTWRAGGVPLGHPRRYLARRERRHVDPGVLALRRLRGSQGRQELDPEVVRQQHLQQALLQRVVSERGAVRSGGARSHRVAGDLGKVLIAARDADLCSECVEQE